MKPLFMFAIIRPNRDLVAGDTIDIYSCITDTSVTIPLEDVDCLIKDLVSIRQPWSPRETVSLDHSITGGSMKKTSSSIESKAPGREWNCSKCGHQNVLGWDRHKIRKCEILPILTGDRMTYFCMNCDSANTLTLVGHFVNLNDNSESSNGGGCPAVAEL